MEIYTVAIEETFYGPNDRKGKLSTTPSIGHDRPVKSTACCPWHGEKTASLVADFSKGTWHCFGCGIDGIIVEGEFDHESVMTLQRVIWA